MVEVKIVRLKLKVIKSMTNLTPLYKPLIEGETNERLSPPRLTRSYLPTATVSPSEQRRQTLLSDSSLTSSEPEPTKDVKGAIGGFPVTESVNMPPLPVAKNRPIKTSKDLELERIVMRWMINIVKEKPESPSMYDKWIQVELAMGFWKWKVDLEHGKLGRDLSSFSSMLTNETNPTH